MIVEAFGWQLDPMPWVGPAACAGAPDPDLWFPNRGQSNTAAKAVCAACCVRSDCLDYALRWGIEHGIWGGLSDRERRRQPRSETPRRLPPRHGTTTCYHDGCRCQRCTEAQMVYKTDREQLLEVTHG